MTRPIRSHLVRLFSLLALAGLGHGTVTAQQFAATNVPYGQDQSGWTGGQPAHTQQQSRPQDRFTRDRFAQVQSTTTAQDRGPQTLLQQRQPQPQQPPQNQPVRQHPLMPAINMAKQSLQQMQGIQDYQCTLVKRERIGNKLGEHEYLFTKIRHEPFSVYMYFLGPEDKGQQVVYVDGANENKLVAQPVGLVKGAVGPFHVDPKGNLAMANQRYPITEVGIRNLTARLLEVAENDRHFGECQVKFYENVDVSGRKTNCIEVTHPVPRRNFRFHIARVYIDKEYNLPTRYESYTWPKQPGGEPILLEEYTYLNLKFNNGFTDADFVIRK